MHQNEKLESPTTVINRTHWGKLISYVSIIVLLSVYSTLFGQKSDARSIDSLSIKTDKIQQQLCALINSDSSAYDYIFLSLYKVRNTQYVNMAYCKKNNILGLACEYEFRPLQLKGYLELWGHNVYIFGDNSISSYFKKAGECRQIPREFESVIPLYKIKYIDELQIACNCNVFNDIPIYTTYDIKRYFIRHNKLSMVNFDVSKHGLNLSIYRTTYRLYDKPNANTISEKKYLKTQKKLTKDVIRYWKGKYNR